MRVLGTIFFVLGIVLIIYSALTSVGPDPLTDSAPTGFAIGVTIVVIGLTLMTRSEPKR